MLIKKGGGMGPLKPWQPRTPNPKVLIPKLRSQLKDERSFIVDSFLSIYFPQFL